MFENKTIESYYDKAVSDGTAINQDGIDCHPGVSWHSVPPFGPIPVDAQLALTDSEKNAVAHAAEWALRDISQSCASPLPFESWWSGTYYKGPEGTVSTEVHYDSPGAPWDDIPFAAGSPMDILGQWLAIKSGCTDSEAASWRLALGDCLARLCFYLRDCTTHRCGCPDDARPSRIIEMISLFNEEVNAAMKISRQADDDDAPTEPEKHLADLIFSTIEEIDPCHLSETFDSAISN